MLIAAPLSSASSLFGHQGQPRLAQRGTRPLCAEPTALKLSSCTVSSNDVQSPTAELTQIRRTRPPIGRSDCGRSPRGDVTNPTRFVEKGVDVRRAPCAVAVYDRQCTTGRSTNTLVRSGFRVSWERQFLHRSVAIFSEIRRRKGGSSGDVEECDSMGGSGARSR